MKTFSNRNITQNLGTLRVNQGARLKQPGERVREKVNGCQEQQHSITSSLDQDRMVQGPGSITATGKVVMRTVAVRG